jgi:REP element-mobilizing transposase RayT
MSRLRRIADRDRVFFVTTNLAIKVSSLSPVERDLILRHLDRQRMQGNLLLFGYVVMPRHFHLLLMPNGRGLAATMHALKRLSAEDLLRIRGTRGPIWQARYFDFILRRAHDFWDKLEYIHQNPVTAGLVKRPEEWRWSSAAHYAKSGRAPVLVDAVNLPADRDALLWPAPWRQKPSGLTTNRSDPSDKIGPNREPWR